MAGGLLVVVIVAIWFANRPPTVGASIEDFAARWGRRETAGIAAMVPSSNLREDLQRRGWLDQPPRLGEAEITERGEVAFAEYACANGKVTAEFALVGEAWRLRGVSLPPLEPGELKPALDAFRAAWNAPGTDRLIELFRPETRDRHRRALNTIFERRGWQDKRPQLGDADPGRISRGRVRVLFGLGFDEVTVRFDYWHPQWYVVALQPPRR